MATGHLNQKTHTRKLRTVLSGASLGTIAQEMPSWVALRDSSKEIKGEPGYTGASVGEKCGQTSKDDR